MAGSCVYRRGVPAVARSLEVARGAASTRGLKEEELQQRSAGTAVDPDVRPVNDGLRSTVPPALFYIPSTKPCTIPFYCTCYSLCHRWAPERDLHVQSFTSVSAEKLSLCLLLSSHGRQQKTLLEAPHSALAHLDQLLAEQVEQGLVLLAQSSGTAVPNEASMCSPLEVIGGSITTVDAQREDDIAESQWRLKTSGPCRVQSGMEGSGLWAWHPNASGLRDWPLKGGDLNSFQTVFDPRLCRMPYILGFPNPDHGSLLANPLLAFQAGAVVQAGHPPGKNDPDMEEHLAVVYERLRHELPYFFLKRHNYGMYSQDVEFENGFLRMKTRGRPMYRAVLTVIRFLAWNYFADVHLEVLKLTRHPENWSVQARWRVVGLPFHVLLLRLFKKDKTELYRYYDAHSTFYLGSDGLIHYHKMDKLMPSQPPLFKTKRLLAGLLVALGMAEHRPSLNLLFSQAFDEDWAEALLTLPGDKEEAFQDNATPTDNIPEHLSE